MVRKLIIVIFLLTSILSAKEKLRPYKLINADSLIVEKQNEYYQTNLLGNVHFFYGDTEFFCDKAFVDEQKKITIMQGNVKVYEDTLSLFAQNSEYHRKDESIFLNKNVKIFQLLPDSTQNKFFAEHITYLRNDSILIAQDNVKAISEKEKISAHCGYLKYNLTSHYGYMIKKPIITKKEKDKLLKISAEKIEYFKDYKKAIASFDVKATFDNFNINSNYLLYFANEEKIVVIGNPEFISKDAKATAKQFVFYLEKNRLKNAELTDNCKVYYKVNDSDSLKNNYVFAKKIKLNFQEEKLKNLVAEDNVKTYYFQKKSPKQDFAKNFVNGDSLYFEMEDNKIKSIFMKKAKEGRYFFEN